MSQVQYPWRLLSGNQTRLTISLSIRVEEVQKGLWKLGDTTTPSITLNPYPSPGSVTSRRLIGPVVNMVNKFWLPGALKSGFLTEIDVLTSCCSSLCYLDGRRDLTKTHRVSTIILTEHETRQNTPLCPPSHSQKLEIGKFLGYLHRPKDK